MPGENCIFYGCSNGRKTPNVSFYKIPTVKSSNSDFTKERKLRARAAWIKALTKTQVIDVDLQHQNDQNTILIFEIHFKEENITRCKMFFVFIIKVAI